VKLVYDISSGGAPTTHQIGEDTLTSTLMSAFARCRRVNSWLACKRLFQALPGRAGDAVVETTVDQTLMRGFEPHDR
jgi:hypothetical protein